MSRVVSEYEVENLLIDRLESISYNYIVKYAGIVYR